ncbi:ring-infected erythrocyte surface antigen-like isoform X1 [Harmonia axyridis]|uniref:ring-infected erythrocyte surface antigen-like isoform X1 n=1 Tax=Harmonia axyridis TaxID=115357 RepID=UPI001E27709C|nr:ring-infected erythrocyte surface antigen-like isoform X1 [Harmonia axyridis]
MPSSCAAYNCSVRSKKGSGVKFHRFPKNEEIRQKWVTAMRRKDFNPSPTTVICSNHFKTEDYYLNPYRNKVLKEGAVPSIFNCPGLGPKIKTTKKKLITNATENTPNLDLTSAKGSGIFHVKEQHVEKHNVEEQCVEEQHAKGKHVEEQHIEGKHIEKQSVEEHVEKQNVEEQHVEEQHVKGKNIEKQNFEEQHVEENHVEKQNFEEQRIEEQHVKEQYVEEIHVVEQYQIPSTSEASPHNSNTIIQIQNFEEQHVEESHVEKQNFEEQRIEEQHVKEQYVEEIHVVEQYQIPSTSEASPHNSNIIITIRHESTPPPKFGTNVRKRKRFPIHVGDFEESDLECPVKRQQYWNVSQAVIQKYRKVNNYLHCKLSRSNKKINNLHDLFLKIL